MRDAARAPNSPRDSGDGVVKPRATNAEIEIEGGADDVTRHGDPSGNPGLHHIKGSAPNDRQLTYGPRCFLIVAHGQVRGLPPWSQLSAVFRVWRSKVLFQGEKRAEPPDPNR